MPLLGYQRAQNRHQLRRVDVVDGQYPRNQLITRVVLAIGKRCGALLGGGAQTLRRHGRRIGQSLLGALTGSRYLRIDDTVLQVLVTRQLLLVQALEGRGHAAIEQIRLGDTAMLTLWEEGLSRHLGELREHPAWSSMSQSLSWDGKRQAMLESIADHLQQLVSREVADDNSKRP